MASDQREVDLIISGAAEVATPRGETARGGAALGELDITEDGALAVDGGLIVAVGRASDLRRAWRGRRELDAGGGILVPGFVDAHTHPVFAGTREEEFEMRVAGASYLEIAGAGGGIVSSVKGVRGASAEELLAALLLRLDRFLALG
ncbi:MAG: imidazolonepropionase, partial [Planctomycetota bacterium]|nr:imidazolonepropionase [Planctomycetota bacterium]